MSSNMIEWLRTKVFPEAMECQSFGADITKFVSFEPNDQKGIDQYASEVIFGDVTLEKENGRLMTESVVIKFQPALEKLVEKMDCDSQFHNEVLFYSEIIPFFKKYDKHNVLSTNFCEFVYGKATDGQNPKEDVIILKNLSKKGFKLTDERIFMDEKHITLALDKIAMYHALSLQCQSDDPVGFHNIVSKIKKPRTKVDEEITQLFTVNTSRGIDYLQNDPKYKDRLSGIYKHCQEGESWLKKHKGPSEQLNVVIHGDFNRKNMMFKYGNTGEPLEVVFFDLGNIQYCSPAIETSCFLFISSTPEVRRLHWDSFLQTYYDSLSKQLDEHAKPSFEEVELDLRKKGVFGYYVCSFGLPFLMACKTKKDVEEALDTDFTQTVKEAGGVKATEYLAEMVKLMLDKNFIFE